jgi:hypothetical protein
MSCDSQVQFAFRKGSRFNIERVGNLTTPDYTVLNQAASTVFTSKFWVETTPVKWSVTKAPNVEWFRVIGNRNLFQIGDLITPLDPTIDSTPTITITQKMPYKTVLGMKTSRFGSIYNGTIPVFENIMFDFLSKSSFPGAPLDREIAGSLNIPAMQAVIFNRQLWTPTMDAEGLFLYEIDRSPQIVWEIAMVTSLGNIQILDLKRNTSR